MKITALLTGKKNSSLKNKNEIKLHNEYIFNYPAKQTKKIKKIDFFYTSSDSKIILNQTRKIGFQSINRPKNLALKDSKHIDVLKHALNIFKKNQYPDILIVLLANAPIVKAKWIRDCIEIITTNKEITSVVPVQNINDHHPERAKQIKNNFLKNFINKKNFIKQTRFIEMLFVP